MRWLQMRGTSLKKDRNFFIIKPHRKESNYGEKG
jgi:hypothetical protein